MFLDLFGMSAIDLEVKSVVGCCGFYFGWTVSKAIGMDL